MKRLQQFRLKQFGEAMSISWVSEAGQYLTGTQIRCEERLTMVGMSMAGAGNLTFTLTGKRQTI